MANQQFTNNASATLSAAINSSATTIPLTVGSGSLFPTLTGSQYFYATLANVSNTILEIIKVTARSGDTLTAIRGQEGTSGNSFSIGDNVQLRATAASLSNFGQVDSANTWSQTQTANIVGNVTGNVTGNITGNAGTATKLAATKNIQGVAFDGSSDITVATAGTGISVTGTSIANTGVLSFNGATGATIGVDLTTNQTIAGNKTFTNNVVGVLKSGTAVASTSGTSIDFTGIPSTAKRITLMFTGVSTSGSSPIIIQIGSGSVTTTGYLGAANVGGATAQNLTTGGGIECAATATTSSTVRHGSSQWFNISGSTWVFSSVVGYSNTAQMCTGGSSVTLSGSLDRVRITTVNGTDTFDAGSVNILWE